MTYGQCFFSGGLELGVSILRHGLTGRCDPVLVIEVLCCYILYPLLSRVLGRVFLFPTRIYTLDHVSVD